MFPPPKRPRFPRSFRRREVPRFCRPRGREWFFRIPRDRLKEPRGERVGRDGDSANRGGNRGGEPVWWRRWERGFPRGDTRDSTGCEKRGKKRTKGSASTSAVLMFEVVFVGGERNGYVEESRFPLAQPFQEETTAMVIRDQVEVAVGDKPVLPVDETTALLCVFGDVAISLLLL